MVAGLDVSPAVMVPRASLLGDANPVCFQVRKTGVRNRGENPAAGSETGVANRMRWCRSGCARPACVGGDRPAFTWFSTAHLFFGDTNPVRFSGVKNWGEKPG